MHVHNEDVPMIAAGVTAAYKAGMECERRYFLEILASIFAAHDYAERNKQTVPSALMSAIVAARARCVLITPAVRERQVV